MKQLKHDHIVNLIEVFRDNGRIFLVFEQLNRTILEELEGNGENGAGIEHIEVRIILIIKNLNEYLTFYIGIKNHLASFKSNSIYALS